MVECAFIAPLLAGVVAFFLPPTAGRPLLVLTGAAHLALALMLWVLRPAAFFPAYFAVTPEGLLSLLVISLLFFFPFIAIRLVIKKRKRQSSSQAPEGVGQ